MSLAVSLLYWLAASKLKLFRNKPYIIFFQSNVFKINKYMIQQYILLLLVLTWFE